MVRRWSTGPISLSYTSPVQSELDLRLQASHWLQVPVWRVSWSITGNLLAVSDANHEVTLWKEQLDGTWTQIQSVQ
jgi:hypothetical protein